MTADRAERATGGLEERRRLPRRKTSMQTDAHDVGQRGCKSVHGQRVTVSTTALHVHVAKPACRNATT
eukprot:CAMPEP_0174871110 /NCGR_PEP_ID=MMETSP1114-20130205/70890_1 /TAXON_ID=312471 /ORGANISM="Neobodo designis, Strain CCAP 1951/1" /LENGTH=67 /DNA_ID=CAMNT_0016106387 /DNA_START=9 /DNA_END=213 /DNA_ORIENTATION=+